MEELAKSRGKPRRVQGGAELFVRAELVPDIDLPKRVRGNLKLNEASQGQERAVFIIAREWDGGKVVTSPIFLTYT